MKRLLMSVVCLLGMTGVANSQEIVVEREIELKAGFTEVAALFLKNPNFLNEATNTEIVEQKPEEMGLTVKSGKGLIIYHTRCDRMKIRNETLWYKTRMAFNRKSVVISTTLEEESQLLHYNIFVIEIHKKGSGTLIRLKSEFSLKENTGVFLAKIVARTRLYRIERSLRELIGEPLEESQEKD